MALVRFTENTIATRGRGRASNQRSIVEFLGNNKQLVRNSTSTAIKVIQQGASGIKRLLDGNNVLAEPEEKKNKQMSQQPGNNDEIMEQQPSTATGVGGSGGTPGGGNNSNSGGGIGGGGTSPQGVLSISNPYDFLTQTQHVFTKRFKFYLENANWISAMYTDKRNNTWYGRQFPTYDMLCHLLMWYIDYAEYVKLRNRFRFAKIEEAAFEITLDSHVQTFKTATTETQLAGNGNVAHIIIHRDYHKRLPTTTFFNETTDGKSLGLLENQHYSLWTKLYGDKIFGTSGTQTIGACDGPRKWTHRPTFLSYYKKDDASVNSATPSTHISGTNFYKARKSSFPVTAIGTSHLLSFKPRTGMVGFGPSSIHGPQPAFESTANAYAKIILHKDSRLREIYNDTDGQNSVHSFSRGKDTSVEGVIANTSANKPNLSTDYAAATLENMQMITAHQPWPTQTMPQLFIGVEPRLLPDGSLITGVTYIEINTVMVLNTEEGHPLPIYPQHNSDADAIGTINNFSFNDTAIPIRTGYTRAPNNSFGWHGAQLVAEYEKAPPTKN